MNLTKTLVAMALILTILLSGCAKKDEQVINEIETPKEKATIEIPTLTNSEIDTFLKIYPIVFEKMTSKKDALEKYRDDNPVLSAQGAKAVEELESELAAIGIDLNTFNAVYQKVLFSTYYLMQKKRSEGISSEQIDAKIAEIKVRVDDPETPAELKPQLVQAISELEAAKSFNSEIPAGLSEEEIKLVESRFTEIQTIIMQQVERARAQEKKSEKAEVPN
ncbi:hypothetical protein KAH81_02835 [bacterium]|nr:hypothetical protein [bacterium]